MAVTAVQHIRKMRGGAQAHLMRASDGHFYVVKFANNPQHLRVLANELLATHLAALAGLPVAPGEIVEVRPWLIEHTPELVIELAGGTLPCRPGLCFGSRYAADPWEGAAGGNIFDYLPELMLDRVRNLEAFAGMLVLDKWTCNCNGRQAVFVRKARERKYTAVFIDQGYCFNAGEWTFPDSPLRGVYARNEVYKEVRGWGSFGPWLPAIEQMNEDAVWAAGDQVPPEWYENDRAALEKLLAALISRRRKVRALIEEFRLSSRHPFPAWSD